MRTKVHVTLSRVQSVAWPDWHLARVRDCSIWQYTSLVFLLHHFCWPASMTSILIYLEHCSVLSGPHTSSDAPTLANLGTLVLLGLLPSIFIFACQTSVCSRCLSYLSLSVSVAVSQLLASLCKMVHCVLPKVSSNAAFSTCSCGAPSCVDTSEYQSLTNGSHLGEAAQDVPQGEIPSLFPSAMRMVLWFQAYLCETLNGFRSPAYLCEMLVNFRSSAYLCKMLGKQTIPTHQYHCGGARIRKNVWCISEIQPYIIGVFEPDWLKQKHVRYHSHCPATQAHSHPDMLYARMPLHMLIQKLTLADLRDLCQLHGLAVTRNCQSEALKGRLANIECKDHITILVPLEEPTPNTNVSPQEHKVSSVIQNEQVNFPPKPLHPDIKNQIIEDFCDEFSPVRVTESGCAVCGGLVVQKSLQPVTNFDSKFFQPLCQPGKGITKCEQLSSSDASCEISGPVLLPSCSGVCPSCLNALRQGKCPRLSLANGGWLGEVPACLQGLSFAEKLMVSRMYHNKFVVRCQEYG